MNKKQMSEQDIRSKFIMPAILKAGWDLQKQIREEFYFTEGRVIVQGTGKIVKRGKPKKVDYILYYNKALPLAIVEAKKNTVSEGEGIQQAIDYAKNLDILDRKSVV